MSAYLDYYFYFLVCKGSFAYRTSTRVDVRRITHNAEIKPASRCNPRPVATGRVSCVCDWLRDATGLDFGDRSWIYNAALVWFLRRFRRNMPCHDARRRACGMWMGLNGSVDCRCVMIPRFSLWSGFTDVVSTRFGSKFKPLELVTSQVPIKLSSVFSTAANRPHHNPCKRLVLKLRTATLMYKTWKLCCHCSTAAKGWPRKFYLW